MAGRRTSSVALGLALAGAAAACGGGGAAPPESAEAPAVARHTVEIDGAKRTYRLFIPPTVGDDRPLPLVLALHGSGNTADSFVQSSRLDVAASSGPFVVAYPEAVRLLWNGGFCCTSGRGDPAVDVRFLERVIADVAARRPVDQSRVYAIGVSAGGIMGYRLACDLAGRIAGVGAVAATMQLDDCRPARPVSVIALHGTGDDVVPYDGGRILGAAVRPAVPAMAVAERWAALNGCPGPAASTVDGLVTTTAWSGCAERSEVRLLTVAGGGHSWFTPDFGPSNGAVDVTTAATSTGTPTPALSGDPVLRPDPLTAAPAVSAGRTAEGLRPRARRSGSGRGRGAHRWGATTPRPACPGRRPRPLPAGGAGRAARNWRGAGPGDR